MCSTTLNTTTATHTYTHRFVTSPSFLNCTGRLAGFLGVGAFAVCCFSHHDHINSLLPPVLFRKALWHAAGIHAAATCVA